MVASKSFASLRQRPSHAKVRSTTHLRGRTSNPCAVSERLIISSRPFTNTFQRLAQFLAGIAAIGEDMAQPRQEIAGTYSGTVTFNGTTGTLTLDHASMFSGQIVGLTGNGNLSSSDILDLKDTAFGAGTTETYTGNSSGGTLTVTDAAHDTAGIALVGNYETSTFTLSSDGNGGTFVVDPPLAAHTAAGSSGSVTVGMSGKDTFVFKSSSDPVGASAACAAEHPGFPASSDVEELRASLYAAHNDHAPFVFHGAPGGHDGTGPTDAHPTSPHHHFIIH